MKSLVAAVVSLFMPDQVNAWFTHRAWVLLENK
jgi:hypothetical protein